VYDTQGGTNVDITEASDFEYYIYDYIILLYLVLYKSINQSINQGFPK